MLPAYRESLDTRYPPICESCMPLIEDEIHRKDQMARVQALGGWLSIGKERQRRASSEVKNPVKAGNDRTLFWWKVRGCLWVISTTFSLVWNISGQLSFGSCHWLMISSPVSNIRSLVFRFFHFLTTYVSFYCRGFLAVGSMGSHICEAETGSTAE